MSFFELLRLCELFPGYARGARLVSHMHLQWFAAEDEGRTEEPTEHKIKKAREEGKVAKSQELVSALVLLFPVVALAILAPYILKTLVEMLRFFLGHAGEIDVAKDGRSVTAFFTYFMRLVLPIGAVGFVSAVLANLVQVGFLFSVKPITPDFHRISPNIVRFFRRALFSTEALFNLGKNILKILIIGAIAYLNIQADLDRISRLATTPFLMGFQLISVLAFRILVESAIVMLVLAVPDYLFQRRQHLESLKMSKQEIKEERKQYEGDPLIKSRLKERMREILTKNMLRNVPRADVVITNPTHYAVAVEYDRLSMPAPTVIAKGQDHLAERIKTIARENGIPVMENKPLARALYAEVEIGDMIPEEYYKVMALILSEVYSLSSKKVEAV